MVTKTFLAKHKTEKVAVEVDAKFIFENNIKIAKSIS